MCCKNGILAWIKKPYSEEYFEAGGIIFEKIGDQLVIKNKAGIVSKKWPFVFQNRRFV